MSHVYQPLMLKTLLRNGGTARTRDIAAAFLAEDESQLDYYEVITNRMPGTVLRRHGIVVKEGDGYALASDMRTLSASEAEALAQLCDEQIATFKAKRGAAIWEHRAVGFGQIPGRLRYETLKRAGFHCELCGVPATERALDVDHIVPRRHGGEDTLENFQALCWQCNTNKGTGDDTDFRQLPTLYAARKNGCVFCDVSGDRVVNENSLAIAIEDSFPVTPLHTLIIPKRHVASYFDLFATEKKAMDLLLGAARERIATQNSTTEAFNIGINDGGAAGQTVFHCDIHLIPRRARFLLP
jgi:diadenosine tetraphosphate (Ap4A) HIT family hydrolase